MLDWLKSWTPMVIDWPKSWNPPLLAFKLLPAPPPPRGWAKTEPAAATRGHVRCGFWYVLYWALVFGITRA